MFVLDTNTWNHTNVCKEMAINKKAAYIAIKHLEMNHISALNNPLVIDLPLKKKKKKKKKLSEHKVCHTLIKKRVTDCLPIEEMVEGWENKIMIDIKAERMSCNVCCFLLFSTITQQVNE